MLGRLSLRVFYGDGCGFLELDDQDGLVIIRFLFLGLLLLADQRESLGLLILLQLVIQLIQDGCVLTLGRFGACLCRLY